MMNSIPPFAYQAAAFFNDRCGFHRKVFAFVLDNTSCYVFRLASRYEMRFPVSAPFFDRQSLWKVYFNLGSQSLSFELSAEERPRVFIRIPFTDVVGIRVSLDSREVVEMEIRLCYALSHYYHGWSGGEMAQIGTCDGLIFGLDIKLEDRKYPELFLLEEALLKCFSLRSKSDFKGQWDVHYDVEGPLASGVNSSKVECVDPFQGYQDPVASFPGKVGAFYVICLEVKGVDHRTAESLRASPVICVKTSLLSYLHREIPVLRVSVAPEYCSQFQHNRLLPPLFFGGEYTCSWAG